MQLAPSEDMRLLYDGYAHRLHDMRLVDDWSKAQSKCGIAPKEPMTVFAFGTPPLPPCPVCK